MRSRVASVSPRLLTRPQAAAYCSLSVDVFGVTCPVRPVSLGDGRRLDRYDVQALDAWIDKLSGNAELTAGDWLSRA